MNQTTRRMADAFREHRPLTITDNRCDGQSLWLYQTKIAEHRVDGVWIQTAGWNTQTTLARLKGLGAVVGKSKGQLMLSGTAWDGSWVKLSSNTEGD